jgi:WD40 repeat protein
MYSLDAQLIGVRNQSSGLKVRVQRMVDGLFVGSIVATVGADGLVSFTPDAMLIASTGDGTLSNWDLSQLTVLQVTGSGYLKKTTTFNVSPDGSLQTAAVDGMITVRRTSDAATVAVLAGHAPVTFSPDGSVLAARTDPASVITLWRTADWSVLHVLSSPNPLEVVGGIRFTPDGQRLAATGYDPFLVQGLWQQKGFIRLWTVAAGTALVAYDQQTSLAVTSPVAWSPGGSQFVYGLYDGTVAVAQTPASTSPPAAASSSIAVTR